MLILILPRKQVHVEMEMDKAIRLAVDSGKVELGASKGMKLALKGKSKLVIVAKNCPRHISADIKHYSSQSAIPIVEYDGTSLELGKICGKPFPVSVFSVLEAGDSDILELAKTTE